MKNIKNSFRRSGSSRTEGRMFPHHLAALQVHTLLRGRGGQRDADLRYFRDMWSL